MNKFFIVGCPRSGTTMLQQALNRHSQIAIPPETTFFIELFGRTLRAQQRYIHLLNADLRIDLPIPTEKLSGPPRLKVLFDQMAYQYLQRLGKPTVTLFGEKTPGHLRCLPEIRTLFPDSKIILIYRDGRDVALSLSQVPWMHHDLHVAFALWLYYFRIHRRLMKNKIPGVYYVKYEDLIVDPENGFRAILNFLGLSFESEVILGNGNSEGIVKREYEWKWRALQPISPRQSGRWQKELSISQVARLERWGRHALTSLGYELSSGGEQRLPLWFFPKLGWDLSVLLTRSLLTRLQMGDFRRLVLGAHIDPGTSEISQDSENSSD
jgi:Sulfotransferase family